MCAYVSVSVCACVFFQHRPHTQSVGARRFATAELHLLTLASALCAFFAPSHTTSPQPPVIHVAIHHLVFYSYSVLQTIAAATAKPYLLYSFHTQGTAHHRLLHGCHPPPRRRRRASTSSSPLVDGVTSSPAASAAAARSTVFRCHRKNASYLYERSAAQRELRAQPQHIFTSADHLATRYSSAAHSPPFHLAGNRENHAFSAGGRLAAPAWNLSAA